MLLLRFVLRLRSIDAISITFFDIITFMLMRDFIDYVFAVIFADAFAMPFSYFRL